VSATYLVDPGAFPTRSEGVPWGGEEARCAAAGVGLHVQGLSELQRECVESLFTASSTRPSPVAVSLFRVEPEAFRRIDTRGWTYSLDFDYGPNHTHLVGIDWMGRLAWEGQSVSAGVWISTEEPGAFQGAFENFLRVLAAHVHLLSGGALLHSAAVVSGGSAHVFVGPSGAGKSTISHAAHAGGRTVVSDDLNVLTSEGALGGSSFFSEIGARRDDSFPLRAIYRLQKGKEDALRPMGGAEALACLIACAPFVNHSRFLAHQLWSNLSNLARKVPGHVLTFRREATFWPLLEES
jgi:hypothetical protein